MDTVWVSTCLFLVVKCNFFLVFHTQQNIEWIDLPLFVLHKYKFNWFGNTFYDVWFWLRDYKFVNWTIKNRIWSTINTAQRTHWVAVIQWKLTQEIPLINFFLTVSCFFFSRCMTFMVGVEPEDRRILSHGWRLWWCTALGGLKLFGECRLYIDFNWRRLWFEFCWNFDLFE